VRIADVSRRTLQYEFTLMLGDVLVGRGTITTGLVRKAPGEQMKMMDLPEDIVARLRQATAG